MIDIPLTAAIVRGAAELEQTGRGLRPHRLPAWARAQTPDPQLALVEAQPSGVRIAVTTQATVVELDTLRTRTVPRGLAPRPAGVYDLVVDGRLVTQQEGSGGDTVTVDLATGATTLDEGIVGTIRFDDLPPGLKRIEIWLPWNESTLLVALRADQPVTPVDDRGRRWLHHGSSISHGSNAASPTGTWPAVAALGAGVQLTNLGLGGAALLDPFTARSIRDTPVDLISLKIGINLVNGDLMRMRAFTPAVHGFLDTIREGHPNTPLLVVSPLFCPIHEHTPGPASFDPEALAAGTVRFRATGDPADVASGRLSLITIRDELARLVAERSPADPHLHHLDGRELYGPDDAAERPLPDNLHPDAATHRLIGERFAACVFGPGAPFGARTERSTTMTEPTSGPTVSTTVLIVGAGPTGLTLACELARRGVAFHLIEAAHGPQPGSRGKGLQPRTLEVFDDLGIVDRVLAHGQMAMPIRSTAPDGQVSLGGSRARLAARPGRHPLSRECDHS